MFEFEHQIGWLHCYLIEIEDYGAIRNKYRYVLVPLRSGRLYVALREKLAQNSISIWNSLLQVARTAECNVVR